MGDAKYLLSLGHSLLGTEMDVLKIALIPILLFAGMGIRALWRGVRWRYLQIFILYFTYPVLMFTEMVKANLTFSLLEAVILSIGYMALCFAVSGLTSRGMDRRDRGTVIFNSTFFNSMFLPFPIIYAFYGDLSVALVFSLPFMVVHNTLGVYLAARWGDGGSPRKAIAESMTFPPILALAAGLLARPFLCGYVSTPQFSLASSIGTLTVYLSLVFAGLMIPLSGESVTLRKRVPALITLNRLVLSPVLSVLIILMFGLNGVLRNTFLIMSFMPTAFTNVIIASRFRLDVEGTVQSVFVPTFISIAAAFLLRFLGLL
jgi:predicted permease